MAIQSRSAARSVGSARAVLGVAAVSLLSASPAAALERTDVETEAGGVTVTTLASGLEHPWGIAQLPDGRLMVTEQPGRLRIVTQDGEVSKPIDGVPDVDARGQGGLLDVTLDPAFERNRRVYLTYAEPAADGTNSTAAARGVLSADERRLQDVEVIFRQEPKVASTKHYGSRLVFDRDGHMYITTGERSERQYRGQAQDLDSLLGKVVRLTGEDAKIPLDNPFLGNPEARGEIWSYGHRNVQGAAIHPDTGKLWTIEHGPKGGDELNIPQAGRNYGWPVVSHGVNYNGEPVGTGKKDAPGFADPIHTWSPVIAPGGMAFYDGAAFPAWRGNLLIAGMKSRAIVRLKLEGERVTGEERMLTSLGWRFNDVIVGRDGAVYAVSDHKDGALIKLAPSDASG